MFKLFIFCSLLMPNFLWATSVQDSFSWATSSIRDSFLRLTSARDLHRAAYAGNLSKVKEEIDKGKIDINHQDWHGWTALHRATYRGHLEVVEELLSRGANPNILR